MMVKLRQEGKNYYINNSKPFNSYSEFKSTTIESVFNFAYSMTFNEDGEHRDHRTGGSYNRKKGQIFINTFQGKLSELAIYNLFSKLNKNAYKKLSEPDFNVYGLGEWDDSDIVLGDLKFSIKSTKFYGNLLLLESKDWDNNGQYIPNKNTGKNCSYNYFVLVRIRPDGEKIMKSNKLLYCNEKIDREYLFSKINSEKWTYDVAGYVTNKEFLELIKNEYILPKGGLLNGKIPMDAENYYIQSGDLNDFQQLIIGL